MTFRQLHKNSTAVMALLLLFGAGRVGAQTTSFTYQGRLTDGGTAATGNYDLQFGLWDSASGGGQIGSTLTLNTVAVSNGVFTVALDFGAGSFNGADRFLEISARPVGAGTFTLLSPRQQVTATPYAIRSANASASDTATNATQLGGVAASQYVQTSDSRLSDARPPTAASANYIQNTSSAQLANFNINGTGSANILSATTQFNIGSSRVLGLYNATGNGGVFVGFQAGTSNTNSTNGSDNAFFGNFAGQHTTDGGENSFFGSVAGLANTSGGFNSFFGAGAGNNSISGQSNSFFGSNTGGANTTGNDNSYFGSVAGSRATGNLNTFIGTRADFLTVNATGNNNTLLGAQSSINSGVNNSTAIGYQAQATQNNSIVLGSISGVNSSTTDTLVGVGTTTPRSALEVKRNWDGSFGALTVTGDRPTVRFSSVSAVSGNLQWILHLGSAAGTAPAGSLSFFNGGTAGTSFGSPVLSLTPTNTVMITSLGSAGSTQLCRNGSNEISTCSSSLRYKTNVASFMGGLEIVNRLRPISFEWKQDHLPDIGLGAEEVEQVAPLLTFRNDKGQIEGVRYDRLGVVFVNAFKEQQAQIEALRQANAALNARLGKLEQRRRKKTVSSRSRSR